MNKSELVQQLAQNTDTSQIAAGKALETLINAITHALSNGDSVSIPGFGSFVVRSRAARAGRNPQTGAAIQIKASKAVAFKAGKALKEAVN